MKTDASSYVLNIDATVNVCTLATSLIKWTTQVKRKTFWNVFPEENRHLKQEFRQECLNLHLPSRGGAESTKLNANPNSSSHLYISFCLLCFPHLQKSWSIIDFVHDVYCQVDKTWQNLFCHIPQTSSNMCFSGEAKVRKSNKAEDCSLTKLQKSLGGHGKNWRAPTQGIPAYGFIVTLMMREGAGTSQISPSESSTLALLRSTALWQEHRLTLNCRLYPPFIHSIISSSRLLDETCSGRYCKNK